MKTKRMLRKEQERASNTDDDDGHGKKCTLHTRQFPSMTRKKGGGRILRSARETAKLAQFCILPDICQSVRPSSSFKGRRAPAQTSQREGLFANFCPMPKPWDRIEPPPFHDLMWCVMCLLEAHSTCNPQSYIFREMATESERNLGRRESAVLGSASFFSLLRVCYDAPPVLDRQ